MSEIAERYERITAQFTERVRAVPAEAWDNPSPCEGCTTRDVVAHLTEWIPGFFGSQGGEFPSVPSAQDDPIGAWETVQATIGKVLEDPATAGTQIETPFTRQSLAETVAMIVTGDVFTHTWDSPAQRGRTRRRRRPAPAHDRRDGSDARGGGARRRHVRPARGAGRPTSTGQKPRLKSRCTTCQHLHPGMNCAARQN